MGKVYRRPMRTGWTLLLIGIIGAYAGVKLGSTANEGFFALAFLGVVLAIAGIATLGVYAAMERGVARALADAAPLLRYTIAAQDFAAYAGAEAAAIRATNKASFTIAIAFCVLMAVAGPFVSRDGIIYTYTGVALAAFLALVWWAATRYRVRKLATANREVVLTTGSAWVGGQFHTWRLPASFLSEVTWFDAGKYEGNPHAIIRITYHALTRTIVTPYTFIVPVPSALEAQGRAAVETLAQGIRPT